jgi:type I site-specific restriction endonuclease
LQNIFDKKNFTERDICTKYITPAIVETAGWNRDTQIREELSLTKGKVLVHGKLHSRGKQKRADYVLYHKANIPLAIVEAKDNTHTLHSGIQQAIEYAELMDVPFAYSSNGDGFIEHDRTKGVERELSLIEFPTPEELWRRYCQHKGIEDPEEKRIYTQDYYPSPENKTNCHQPQHRSHRQGSKTSLACDGHRHRKNIHVLSNHLAPLEIRHKEKNSLSGGQKYSRGPSKDQGLQAIRVRDDQNPKAQC